MTFIYVGNRRPRPSSWDMPAPPRLGIGIFRYRDSDAAIEHVKDVCPEISVGAVWIDMRRQVLYCVHESLTLPGFHQGGGGQVVAYAINPANGDLTELNRQPSHGTLPSYVVVDIGGKYLLATHHTGHTPITRSVTDASGAHRIALEYDDATSVVYRLLDDGCIGEVCDVFQHRGEGGPLPLQTHSQLHSIEMSPSGALFVVCDKGSDEIALFRLDRSAGRLLPCAGSPHKAPPGSSPRYSAFHPSLPYLYVNHETLPLVTAYRYDARGHIEQLHSLELAAGAPADGPKLMQSDLRMHPNGRYLYTLLRGSNEIKVLEVDQDSGRIGVLQSALLDGDGPRGCTVSPDGRFLLIAALVSKEVMVWRIGDDGHVAPVGRVGGQPFPGNITFYKPA